MIAWPNPHGAWTALQGIAEVVGERRIGGELARHPRYYLSSLPGGAATIAHAVRSHWGIENQVH